MSDEKRFRTKKSLGQHFLTSEVVPNWMCDAAEISTGDTVVEVGPGTGILTSVLLRRGATVIALEADERALAVLEERFAKEVAARQLVLHHLDVRDFSTEALGLEAGSYKVVANIPYYLSGLLFRTFLAGPIQPATLVFLVQKEVARRATAQLSKGEKESLLSLSVKVYGEPYYVKTVSRGHFNPPPLVESGIVAVRNISRERFSTLSEVDFFSHLRLGFGQKRKQLLGNLSNTFKREEVEACFTKLNIPLTVRAEDLSVETWLELSAELSTVS